MSYNLPDKDYSNLLKYLQNDKDYGYLFREYYGFMFLDLLDHNLKLSPWMLEIRDESEKLYDKFCRSLLTFGEFKTQAELTRHFEGGTYSLFSVWKNPREYKN